MPGEEQIYLELDDRRIVVQPGEQTLGRSHGCGVVLEDRSVSRVHAMIAWALGRLTVQDLNSSNGTYLNGELLQGEAELRDGDLILLGEARLRIRRLPGTQSERIPVDELSAVIDERFTDRSVPRKAADLTRSEVISAGEVMAIGELLATEPDSELKTSVYPAASPQDTRPVPPQILPDLESLLPAFEDVVPFPPPGDLEEASDGETSGTAELSERDLESFLHLSERLPGPAGFGSRLAAGLFDFVFLGALTLLVSYLRGGTVTAAGRSLALWFGLTFGGIAALASWVVWGATPGQRMVGLTVSDPEGKSPVGVLRALRRLMGFAVTVASFGLGFVMVLFHPEGLAFQDLVSGTRVVRR